MLKKNSKAAVWGIALMGLVARLVSSLFTIDAVTGFILPEYRFISVFLSILSFVCAVAVGFLLTNKKGLRVKTANSTEILAIISFAVAVFSAADALLLQSRELYPAWQIALVTLIGILNSLFFAVYGIFLLRKKNMPGGWFTVPFLFSIVKLVRFFALTSSITVITDNFFATLCYASFVIFMLEFLNLKNGMGGAKINLKFYVSGYISVLLCAYNTLPRLLRLLVNKKAIAHENIVSTLLCLVLGIFIFTAVFVIFDKKKKKG